jgi:hemolysin III
MLVLQAPSDKAAWAAGVYGLSLVVLLAVSAFYHRPNWQPRARALLRRLDHSAIFVLIAGSYTPICLLVLGEERGNLLLFFVWAGAGIGIALSLFWPKAPKPLVALCCVVLGSVVVLEWTTFSSLLSRQILGLILVGGVLYALGAVVYSLRRPDPWPEIFGYHEVFHAMVLASALLHFIAVSQIVFEFG